MTEPTASSHVPDTKLLSSWTARLSAALSSDIGKTIAVGVITAIGGYLAAALISPDQLYRWLYIDPIDRYVGTWRGPVAGRYAELTILKEDRDGAGRTVGIEGVLVFPATGLKLPIVGSADSVITLEAELDPTQTLVITLERSQSPIRSNDERVVKLFPRAGSSGVAVCPVIKSPLDVLNAPPCKPILGETSLTF
ncbi:hypothetical protein [Porphyrobacter sp. ULC335]|uniref:hypothetical protein n=1 Tax=Porphyrobacter sp. ULC335 TaxID=2854260 RepID=UPI002220AD71|nr:hypothetical protein [Porphyrobacter sp. ULC335]UYV15930.1 hypothetical protein KVF90_00825 [Porphyrobacter sp. ULC335]